MQYGSTGSEFTRDEALGILGLSGAVTGDRILQAYRLLSQPLKRLVVTATSVDDKDRRRQQLRDLMAARDVALGRPVQRRAEGLAVEWRVALARLEHVGEGAVDRAGALKALELNDMATDERMRTEFRLRYRALTRALGSAESESLMRALREARLKLRRVRAVLLGGASDDDPSDIELPEDGVRTDVLLIDSADAGSPSSTLETRDPLTTVSETDVTRTDVFEIGMAAEQPPDPGREASDAVEDPATDVLLDGVLARADDIEESDGETVDFLHGSPDSGVRPKIGSDGESLLALGRAGATARDITEHYRVLVRPLRVAMLLAQQPAEQQGMLQSIRKVRQSRDRALRDVRAIPDDVLDLPTDDFDKLFGL